MRDTQPELDPIRTVPDVQDARVLRRIADAVALSEAIGRITRR